jgi:hypothetical protein
MTNISKIIDFPRINDNKLPIVPPKEQPRLPFDDLGKPESIANKKIRTDAEKERDREQEGIAAVYFKNMKTGVDYIEKLMGTFVNDTAQLSTQIEAIEKEKKTHIGLDGQPLEKLQNLLEEWDRQEIETKEDLTVYANELWKTAKEFDKELRGSLKGHELEMKKLKFSSSNRFEWIKYKTNYLIDVHEEALRMTKEKYMIEIENLTMKISEMESRNLNMEVKDPELTHILNLDTSEIEDIEQIRKVMIKVQNAAKTLKAENLQYSQAQSGYEHRIATLEEEVRVMNIKCDDITELKDIYEGAISSIVSPPMKIIDTTAFSKYRKCISKGDPREVLDFLEESDTKPKIALLSEQIISLVDFMNDLKATFENVKMVPDRLIEIDPTAVSIKKVELNDRIQNLFFEAFISGSH